MKRHYYLDSYTPCFPYKVRVKNGTDDMIDWCEWYAPADDFSQFHVEWLSEYGGSLYPAEFQFEDERAALLFKLKFGDL